MPHFRKKFSLACAMYVTGTVLAFRSGASLAEYTAFASLLLAVFGASDVGDKVVAKKGNRLQGES